jgi:hypothetical protein
VRPTNKKAWWPGAKAPGCPRRFEVRWVVKDSNRVAGCPALDTDERAAARRNLQVAKKSARLPGRFEVWWAVKDSNLGPID